jgi:hypothetical protein
VSKTGVYTFFFHIIAIKVRTKPCCNADTNSIELPEIYNSIISNHSSQYVTLAVEPTRQRYLIPAASTFLMGQLDDSMDILSSHGKQLVSLLFSPHKNIGLS